MPEYVGTNMCMKIHSHNICMNVCAPAIWMNYMCIWYMHEYTHEYMPILYMHEYMGSGSSFWPSGSSVFGSMPGLFASFELINECINCLMISWIDQLMNWLIDLLINSFMGQLNSWLSD